MGKRKDRKKELKAEHGKGCGKVRRQENKGVNKLRRKNLKELRRLADDVPQYDDTKPWELQFNEFWPLVQQALITVRDLRITGLKTDSTIDDILEYGEALFHHGTQQTEFTEAIQPAWGLISGALEVITLFTKGKTTEVIETIIEIGDWLTQTEEAPDVALAVV